MLNLSCIKPKGVNLLPVLLILALGWAAQGVVTPAGAAETVVLPLQSVAPGEAALTVNVVLPSGCKLNQEAPSTVSLKTADNKVVALEGKKAQNRPLANHSVSITVPVQEGKTTLEANLRLNYCDDKLGLCFLKEALLQLPVEVTKTAAGRKLELVYTVTAN